MGSFLRIQPVRTSKETVLKSGRVCIAADMEGENLYGYRFPEKSVLLIGNEARGLDEQWFKEKHVQRVSIPRFGQAESLNAAMAAGIFLSHWRQQTSF
jgi:TrmH family RNA methyltransferase